MPRHSSIKSLSSPINPTFLSPIGNTKTSENAHNSQCGKLKKAEAALLQFPDRLIYTELYVA